MKRPTIAMAALIVMTGLGLFLALRGRRAMPVEGSPAEAVAPDLTFEDGGATYVVVDGDAYRVTRGGGREFVDHLYDPDFFAKNYAVQGGEVLQKDPESGRLYSLTRSFGEDFENAASMEDLLTPSRWHTNNTDPRRESTKYNYYDLGNRVTLARDVVHGGLASLRCHAVPSSGTVSKASLSRNLVYFAKGDEFFFSGWFFIEDTPSIYDAGGFTLFDLESSFVKSVGLRLIFRRNDSLAFELELPKTQFKQERGAEVPFPTGQWVHVEAQAFLSDEAGRVQVWQDGRKVLDQPGRTLPLSDTVYDRFEVGISAIAEGSRYEKVLYVDDVRVSNSPLHD